MSCKQIGVIGAGAVGGVFAWKILTAGYDQVSFIATGARRTKLLRDGLVVDEQPMNCEVIDPYQSPAPMDLLVVAVKAE